MGVRQSDHPSSGAYKARLFCFRKCRTFPGPLRVPPSPLLRRNMQPLLVLLLPPGPPRKTWWSAEYCSRTGWTGSSCPKTPAFVAKLRDVVGLSLHPPERAVVFSVDEKSQSQALDRTQPGLAPQARQCRPRLLLASGGAHALVPLDTLRPGDRAPTGAVRSCADSAHGSRSAPRGTRGRGVVDGSFPGGPRRRRPTGPRQAPDTSRSAETRPGAAWSRRTSR